MFKNLKELIQWPKKEKCLCMVVSEQEGAEIWVNGRFTGATTPQLIPVYKNQDVLLEVKQRGYETHRVSLRSPQQLSFHYCDLQRIPLRLVSAPAGCLQTASSFMLSK